MRRLVLGIAYYHRTILLVSRAKRTTLSNSMNHCKVRQAEKSEMSGRSAHEAEAVAGNRHSITATDGIIKHGPSLLD